MCALIRIKHFWKYTVFNCIFFSFSRSPYYSRRSRSPYDRRRRSYTPPYRRGRRSNSRSPFSSRRRHDGNRVSMGVVISHVIVMCYSLIRPVIMWLEYLDWALILPKMIWEIFLRNMVKLTISRLSMTIRWVTSLVKLFTECVANDYFVMHHYLMVRWTYIYVSLCHMWSVNDGMRQHILDIDFFIN